MFGSETEFVDWLKRVCKARRPGPDRRDWRRRRHRASRPATRKSFSRPTFRSKVSTSSGDCIRPGRSVTVRLPERFRMSQPWAASRGLRFFRLPSRAALLAAGWRVLRRRAGSRRSHGRGDHRRRHGFSLRARRLRTWSVAGEVPIGTALLRSGARPGDQIFVSGHLGRSALGLRMLKSGKVTMKSDSRHAGSPVHTHLYPEPRLELGRFLRESRLASALMDLSDGLSTDLARMCKASGVGAVLWSERIPLPNTPSETARAGPPTNRDDSLALALNGGEDYELLFTVPRRKAGLVPKRFRGLPITCIGEIRRSTGLFLALPDGSARPLQPGGFEHFRRSRKGTFVNRPHLPTSEKASRVLGTVFVGLGAT